MTISKAISLRINELLKEKNISRYKLSNKMGISKDTLKSIYGGKTQGVNLKTIIIIAEGFDMSISEFLNSDLFSYENLTIE